MHNMTLTSWLLWYTSHVGVRSAAKQCCLTVSLALRLSNLLSTVVHTPNFRRFVFWGVRFVSERYILQQKCMKKWISCRFTVQFLARDSIYAIARVRLSVRLSVTRVDQSKTVEVRITQPSPQSSPMILVSWRLTSPWNSKGKIGSGVAE